MIEVIHEFRVEADTLSKQIKMLPGSPEVTKANNSITMVKCWLGKLLGQLGEETPYKNDGKRKEIKDIEPAADSATTVGKVPTNQVEAIDTVRERITALLKNFNELVQDSNPETISPLVILVCIEQHLHECRFWLGLELGRIRDSHSPQSKL
jgi:hypothetical protein